MTLIPVMFERNSQDFHLGLGVHSLESVSYWPESLKLSFDIEPIYDVEFFLLGLYVNNINSKYRSEYVLLMEKLEGKNEFRRIGVGEIARVVEFEDRTSWFDDVEEQRILIR